MRDDQLVVAIQLGDTAALGTLFDRHRHVIYGYLRSRLLDPADAEDMCQEVFIRCLQANGQFAGASIRFAPGWWGSLETCFANTSVASGVERRSAGPCFAWKPTLRTKTANRMTTSSSFCPAAWTRSGPTPATRWRCTIGAECGWRRSANVYGGARGRSSCSCFARRQALKNCINLKTGCPVEGDKDAGAKPQSLPPP